PTTTSVAMSLDPALAGQPVTFTATITPTNSSSYLPTGTVQFQADGINVGGPVVITNSGGQITATLTTSSLGAGTHTITASYGGDRNFATSSGTLAGGQTIMTGTTSTTLSLASSVEPSLFGQTVTFSAVVLASSLDMPTGMVTFYDGSTLLGQAAIGTSLGLAMASFSTAGLAVGAHTITASYGGDSNFAASSGTLAGGQTVTMAGTSTAVSPSANPSSVGEMVCFTATVSPLATGSTQGGVPTGMVTFFDGSTTLGQAPLSTAGGVTTASFSTASLSAGAHTITASYSGDGSFLTSSGIWTQTVSTASTIGTTTTVTSSTNAARYGQPVTFTATVSITVPPSTAVGYPTGTVIFSDNGTSIGQGTLSTVGGVTTASFTGSLLTTGTQTITATYSGDAIFLSSNGTLAGGLTVTSAGSTPTTTQVTTSSSTVQAGQPVTLTATVSPFSYFLPTGTVQFQVDGVNFAAPVAVTNGGSYAVATLTTTALPVGTHTITARYNGDNSYAASTGRMWGYETVTAPPIRGDVTTTLDASGTLTLTVAAGGGFTVTQDPQGNLLVTGDASAINGSTAPASFSAVSAIIISLADGNNDVTLSGITIPGSITISAGAGADSFTLSGITVGNAGTPSGTTIPGSIVINAGSGSDNFTLTGISADVLNLGATGPDSASVSNVTARNDLNITVGPGSPAISVLNTACLDLTIQAQSSTSDNLNINLENDTVTHTTQGGLAIDDAGTGTDTVTLNNAQNGLSVGYELAVMLSSGSNSLSAAQVTTLFGTVDGGTSGNNSYFGQGSNQGYALYDFLGH
ncbi:MAG TPA: Ig-like domain-containing protein, partial [Gemmataceae bacterium]|nr:Ig-like domain-containing protein [Gemmataceae bacterium]